MRACLGTWFATLWRNLLLTVLDPDVEHARIIEAVCLNPCLTRPVTKMDSAELGSTEIG